MDQKRIYKKFKHYLLASVSALSLAVGVTADSNGVYIDKDKQFDENLPTVFSPVKVITFQNDTLYKKTSALMSYLHHKITRNYVENVNSYNMRLFLFSHEDWHEHNDNSGYSYKFKFSPTEYRKLCIWDEISANYASVETALLEIKTTDELQKVLEKYENTYMNFFVNAIKQGKIDPFSTNPYDGFKIQQLIANRVPKRWMKSLNAYSQAHNKMLKTYLQRVGFFTPRPQNYRKIRSYMCTIGGINLSKLLDEDINYMDNKLFVLERIPYVHSLVKDSDIKVILADDYFNHFPMLEKVSIEGQEKAFQHIFIAAKLKYEIFKLEKSKIPLTQSAMSTCYNKVMFELSHDKSFFNFVKECGRMGVSPFPYEAQQNFKFSADSLLNTDRDIISKFYIYKNANLLDLLNTFNMEKTPVEYKFAFNPLFISEKNPLLCTDFYCPDKISDKTDSMLIKESISLKLTDKSAANTVNSPVLRRRLSKNLYMQLPNFEEKILIDDAMGSSQWNEIRNLFKNFEIVPLVFRGTSLKAQERYKDQHPDEKYDYFEAYPKTETPLIKEKPQANIQYLFWRDSLKK